MTNNSIFEHALTISPLLRTAVEAAIAAGKIVAGGANEILVVEQKGIGDLVSQVDRDADQAACAVLQAASEFPIMSEELNADQPPLDEMWIVDPLDASSAFLMSAGPSFPSVLVALRQEADLKLGVVYFPLTNEWFYAFKGRGAWKDGKRLVCDSKETLSEIWVEMNQYGNAELETDFFSNLRKQLRSPLGARLVTTNVPNSGVAMRIATGRNPLAIAVHDNNPASTKQGPWDIAAPQIVMEEAGGVFINPDGQRTNPFVTEPIIVSRSAKLAQQIIELTSEPATD